MVGQEHVLRALINALDHERLHHAYLFTGTRGVGKTTIARILARCFNCESGISSAPCGTCSICVEIGEGRSVDLIEVDAASRTKVEDTRDLLDNVQYAPTRSRFKIYLIDEVHMLSNHSFNALLKTLEEPPEHVKFLLATTDPQKLPVTILSRCLQFNLKNMSLERIVGHLKNVLEQEVVSFDEPALWLLAHAADGSMRDALSLCDQAIAFGNGKVAETDVAAMLGTINPRLVQHLIDGLIAEDAQQLLSLVASFSEHAPDYGAALADLLNILHRIAVAQVAPHTLDNSFGDRDIILRFAENIAAEDVQLFYQTALVGRRDLNFAANPRSGFEMTLLRMLAFKPQGLTQVPTRGLRGAGAGKRQSTVVAPVGEVAGDVKKPIASAPPPRIEPPPVAAAPQPEVQPPPKERLDPPLAASAGGSVAGSQGAPKSVVADTAKPGVAGGENNAETQEFAAAAAGGRDEEKPPANTASDSGKPTSESLRQQIKAISGSEGFVAKTPVNGGQEPQSAPVTELAMDTKVSLQQLNAQTWIKVYKQLKIKGILQSTASNCLLLGREQNCISMAMDDRKGTLFDPSHTDRLQGLLCDYFGEALKLEIHLMPLDEASETPAVVIEREKRERFRAVVDDLQSDPVVQTLQREFGASIIHDSIKGASGN